jgi:hypothetical protein
MNEAIEKLDKKINLLKIKSVENLKLKGGWGSKLRPEETKKIKDEWKEIFLEIKHLRENPNGNLRIYDYCDQLEQKASWIPF